MSPTPAAPAPLAPEWSFVVQLRSGTSFEAAAVCGRVEHVASGQAGNFDSMDTLRLFMQRVLHRQRRARSGRAAGGEVPDGCR